MSAILCVLAMILLWVFAILACAYSCCRCAAKKTLDQGLKVAKAGLDHVDSHELEKLPVDPKDVISQGYRKLF